MFYKLLWVFIWTQHVMSLGVTSMFSIPRMNVNAKVRNSNSRSVYTDNLVVGGGLCGLTSAYYLHKDGKDVLLCDEGEKLGGNIRTKRGNYVFLLYICLSYIYYIRLCLYTDQGFIWEEGPNSFQPTTAILEFLRDLNLTSSLILADPSLPRFVVMNKLDTFTKSIKLQQFELKRLPMSIIEFFSSSLLTIADKIRIITGVLGWISAPPMSSSSSLSQEYRRPIPGLP